MVRAHPGAFFFFVITITIVIKNITLQEHTDFNFLLNVQTGPGAHQAMGALLKGAVQQWRREALLHLAPGLKRCMLLRVHEQHYLYLYLYIYTTLGPCSLCTIRSCACHVKALQQACISDCNVLSYDTEQFVQNFSTVAL